jgi:hypothetical protein
VNESRFHAELFAVTLTLSGAKNLRGMVGSDLRDEPGRSHRSVAIFLTRVGLEKVAARTSQSTDRWGADHHYR